MKGQKDFNQGQKQLLPLPPNREHEIQESPSPS